MAFHMSFLGPFTACYDNGFWSSLKAICWFIVANFLVIFVLVQSCLIGNHNTTFYFYIDYAFSVWFPPLMKSNRLLFTSICKYFYLQFFSLLCCIILGAAKRVDCYAAYTSAYGFYNFAFGSCILTYILRYIIYIFNLNTRLLWVFPWLIWVSNYLLFHNIWHAVWIPFSFYLILLNSCPFKTDWSLGIGKSSMFMIVLCFDFPNLWSLMIWFRLFHRHCDIYIYI